MDASSVLIDKNVVCLFRETLDKNVEVILELCFWNDLDPLCDKVCESTLEKWALKFVLVDEVKDINDVKSLILR